MSSLFVERRSLEFISKFDFRPSVDFVPGLLASLEVRSTLLGPIGEAQRDDPQLVEIVEKNSISEVVVFTPQNYD